MRQQARPRSSKPQPKSQSMHQLMAGGAPDDVDAPSEAPGRGNGTVIAIISLALLGGTGYMLYSIAPDLFRPGRPQIDVSPRIAAQPAPMPDLSPLLTQLDARKEGSAADASSPKRATRLASNDFAATVAEPAKQPGADVLNGIRKWTGMNGWKSDKPATAAAAPTKSTKPSTELAKK